jgi:hypothetical protein
MVFWIASAHFTAPNAGELCQDAVASRTDDAAPVLAHHGQQDSLMCLEIPDRPLFVSANECTVASDIGRQDRRQPSGTLGISRSV